MGISDSYNFRRVDDRVTTSGVVGADRLAALRAEGYALVINLLPDESEYAVEDERQIVEGQGVRYVHIPVNFSEPALADYEEFVAAMTKADRGKVHIHCAANYRASAFYAAYAESRGWWRSSEAARFVASLWQPQEHEGWRDFMAALKARARNS